MGRLGAQRTGCIPKAGSGYCAELKAPSPQAPTAPHRWAAQSRCTESPAQEQAGLRQLVATWPLQGGPRWPPHTRFPAGVLTLQFTPLPPSPLWTPGLVWAPLYVPGTAVTTAIGQHLQITPEPPVTGSVLPQFITFSTFKFKNKSTKIAARKMEPWVLFGSKDNAPDPYLTPQTKTHSHV